SHGHPPLQIASSGTWPGPVAKSVSTSNKVGVHLGGGYALLQSVKQRRGADLGGLATPMTGSAHTSENSTPSTALAMAGSTADVGGSDLTGPAIVSGCCASAGSSGRSLWTPFPGGPSFSESDMTGDQGIIWTTRRNAVAGGGMRLAD